MSRTISTKRRFTVVVNHSKTEPTQRLYNKEWRNSIFIDRPMSRRRHNFWYQNNFRMIFFPWTRHHNITASSLTYWLVFEWFITCLALSSGDLIRLVETGSSDIIRVTTVLITGKNLCETIWFGWIPGVKSAFERWVKLDINCRLGMCFIFTGCLPILERIFT